MSRLFLVRDAVPSAGALPADLTAAVNRLLRTAADADFTMTDLLGDLFVLATCTLGVVGATVAFADGTGLHFRRGGPDDACAVRVPWQVSETSPPGERLAVAALPMMAGGRVWGVLDFYRPADQGWPADDLAAARSFSQVAAASIAVARVRDQSRLDAADRDRRRAAAELAAAPHRALLLDRVEGELSSSARHRRAVGVLVIDVDGFRQINARMGHRRGDLLLAELARRIRHTLPAGHTLTPMSGDAFAVVCGDLAGSPSQVDHRLREVGLRIQLELRHPGAGGAVTPLTPVSVSIGAAVATSRRTAEDLLGAACAAMIEAKGRGRGQVVVSEPAVVPLAGHRSARQSARGT
jgi:diguanylate cyclase (GGDEF)-like protein